MARCGESVRNPALRNTVTKLLRIWSKRRRIPRRSWDLLTYHCRCALWSIWKRTRRELTVTTMQGVFSFRAGLHEAIGECLYCARHFDSDTLVRVMQLLKTIDVRPVDGETTMLDVGANVGVIGIGFINGGLAQRAVAIEVEPSNFAFLRRNVAQNRMEDRIFCVNCAANDRKGRIVLEISPVNSGDHRVRAVSAPSNLPEIYGESRRKTIALPCDTLDNIMLGTPEPFRRSISVLWIDVQGQEYHVFCGAHGILSSGVPVFTEFWPYGMRRARVRQEDYLCLAQQYWSDYWVFRRGKYVRFPIAALESLFQEIGYEGEYDNVIFTRVQQNGIRVSQTRQ
jgi:FkbM family methyltransferase